MILGFVGGDPGLNERLGKFLNEEYGVEPVRDSAVFDGELRGDKVLLNVETDTEAEWLHDDLGARLIYLNHPSNEEDETRRELCSVSVDCAGGYDRAREKLEMVLMGCC